MADTDRRANPLFASPPPSSPRAISPSRIPCQRAAKLGGYGGVAVAAWLITAVATGQGVAAADTTGTSSQPSSTSAASTQGTKAVSTKKAAKSSRAAKSGADSISTETGSAMPRTATTNKSDTTTKPASSSSPARMAAVSTDSSGRAHDSTGVPRTKPTVAHRAEVDRALTPSQSSATVSANVAPVSRTETANTAATQAETAVSAAVAPTPHIGSPAGPLGALNTIVTDLLNPFLAPPPNTPGPVTPAVWAVLGWVRRNVFNEAPTINAPSTTLQTGQTVTGNIGATDPEGDTLTYTVTKGPQNGTLSIDQVTGAYTYTPNDINYAAAQSVSFTVSITDGKGNLLSLFGQPHSAQTTDDVTVLNPAVQRVILDMPDGVTKPVNPRYSEDGNSIYFAATPAAGGRQEIYQINTDGTDAICLTCGVSTNVAANLGKPVPFTDGTGRVVVLVDDGSAAGPTYDVLEDGVNGRQLIPIVTPPSPSGVIAVNQQREMRISPDGTHVLFSRIELGQNGTGVLQIVPIVGTLTRTINATTGATEYDVTDARVVYPTGEGKQWTPDGKGVIILGGAYEQGNADDIEVDLATGNVTRVTASLDYDEDIDESPNEQWIAIGSTRGLNALTPMTRIVRQSLLPVYVAAPIYLEYATPVNVSNQEWAVAVGDELNRENGIPLFDTGDGWAARSMPSWNTDGSAVTFWESSVTDPTQSRLVIANLKYTTSVGPVATDRTTPTSDSWAPSLSTYTPTTTPLPAVGTYAGVGGGTAVVNEAPDPTNAARTVRTVTYSDYVNEDGMILNGTESADYAATQSVVHYVADVTVTGTHTGYLRADATINAFQQSLTGYITSDVDGDIESIPDQAAATAAQQNA